MHTVLIEGQSTAHGNFDYERGGWAARLHVDAMTESSDNPAGLTVVTNRARPGVLLQNILPQYEADMRTTSRLGPVTAVLSAGLQESKIVTGANVPLTSLRAFGDQLLRFSEVALDADALQVFVGPQPIDDVRTRPIAKLGSFLDDNRVEAYAETMRDIADITETPYVDVRAAFQPYDLHELLADDGYHPNAAGHAVIHEAVRQVVDVSANY